MNKCFVVVLVLLWGAVSCQRSSGSRRRPPSGNLFFPNRPPPPPPSGSWNGNFGPAMFPETNDGGRRERPNRQNNFERDQNRRQGNQDRGDEWMFPNFNMWNNGNNGNSNGNGNGNPNPNNNNNWNNGNNGNSNGNGNGNPNPNDNNNWNNGNNGNSNGNPNNNNNNNDNNSNRGTTTFRPTLKAPLAVVHNPPAGCNCQYPPQFNPVCGSDGQNYKNQALLECVNRCGTRVTMRRRGTC